MATLHVKKGDVVTVITGNESIKGKSGKVLQVLTKKNQVIVEGLRLIKKHQRASQSNPQGGIISREGPIHISNVMLYDVASGKGERVGRKTLGDGRKVRVFRSTGEVVDA